jgi:hypothetical protein
MCKLMSLVQPGQFDRYKIHNSLRHSDSAAIQDAAFIEPKDQQRCLNS